MCFRSRSAAAFCFPLLLLAACDREKRQLRDLPARSGTFTAARESVLLPGGPVPEATVRNPYEGNAQAISEGQTLFDAYNCSGCHFHGGGGMGPPLMRQQFIYGKDPQNIFDTINKGRPNGMPSWGGRIPESNIWKLVAYVRSFSGSEPMAATPQRADHLEKKTAAQLK